MLAKLKELVVALEVEMSKLDDKCLPHTSRVATRKTLQAIKKEAQTVRNLLLYKKEKTTP